MRALPPRLARAVLAPLIAALAASHSGSAQGLSLPAAVGPYQLRDSSRYDKPELGVQYAFSSPERVPISAYVYPVPPELLQLDGEARIAQEVKSFLETLSVLSERGVYSELKVVVDEPRTFKTRDGAHAGHVVAAVLRMEDRPVVSFMHLVVIGDQYVKTRVTVPAEQWETSLSPNFGPDLFRLLPVPPDPAPQESAEKVESRQS